MPIELYPNWETILQDLADLFNFEIQKIGTTLNNFGGIQYRYIISDMSYARKADLDDYIKNGTVGGSEYARASVLYSLYACRYLTVVDIKYPTYQDWKKLHGLSLDHSLPRYWFPRLTFDCTNWKPMPIDQNRHKGDDFLEEGLERLGYLSEKIKDIKSKYL